MYLAKKEFANSVTSVSASLEIVNFRLQLVLTKYMPSNGFGEPQKYLITTKNEASFAQGLQRMGPDCTVQTPVASDQCQGLLP